MVPDGTIDRLDRGDFCFIFNFVNFLNFFIPKKVAPDGFTFLTQMNLAGHF